MAAQAIRNSPFDRLLLDIAAELNQRNPAAAINVERLGFLHRQLGLLRAAYVGYRGASEELQARIAAAGNHISLAAMALEYALPSLTVFLGYDALINTLCQLDRALPRHIPNAGHIPLAGRIRFYRNKVAEHWDDYTGNISAGMTWKKGRAPVPSVESVILAIERQTVLAQLKQTFQELGASLNWPDDMDHSGIVARPEYSDAVFTAIESLRGGLTMRARKSAVYDRMITLLLRFGFPAPILDVEEYAALLEGHLRHVLNVAGVDLRSPAQ